MKRFFILCSLLFIFLGSFSQEKQNLSIEDAVVGLYTEYYPDYISNLQWHPGNKYYTFKEKNAIKKQIPGAKSSNDILNLDELNAALIRFGGDSIKYIPYISWDDADTFRFSHNNAEYFYSIKEKQIVKEYSFPESAQNIDYNAPQHMYAFTQGNNLKLLNAKGEFTELTNERDLGIVYGQTVHRNEFGIEKGTFWSPNGNKLAFYRKDETKVGEYPLVDITKRIAQTNMIRYPMAGTHSEEVTLMIYDVKSNETITIETGKPKEQFLTNISWSPDEKYIYIAILNREQNHMKFNCYNAKTGAFVKTLFEEKNNRYVEPLHPAMFVPNKPETFIWQSRRDGYTHLYLYNTKGEMLKQLTKGNFEITDFYKFSSDGNFAFIQANKQSPIDFGIYKLDLSSGEMIGLNEEPGTHRAIVSDDGNNIIDNYQSVDIPNRYEFIDTNKKKREIILNAENPLSKFNMPKCEVKTIKAADDSTELYYRLITPSNLEEGKKYPAIIYVYGGPHAQLITNSWLAGAQGWLYYMAQQGYVMLTIDSRGSANRGMEFESVIHRNLGVIEIADQMEGVKLLKKLGYVDMDRIGVHGWSYGGFLTTTLMCDKDDIFKVGCAGGPVIDWKYYEIMYGERYMDTPDENPDGYSNSSLVNKADKLTGRLLIIHGAQDPVVVWQNSQAFLQACIKAGTIPDYFVYPTHEHNVRGYDRIHLMRMVTRYFNDHL